MRTDALQPPSNNLMGFDLIVSNPPYIPSGDIAGLDRSVRDFEPHLALDGGEDGLDFYRSITAQWQRALKPGGTLLVEVGIHQADDVEHLFAEAGFQNIKTSADYHDIWRAVEGTIPG